MTPVFVRGKAIAAGFCMQITRGQRLAAHTCPSTSDLWSAVTRHRFLFQVIWLWKQCSFVRSISPEIAMNDLLFSHAD